MNIKSIPITIQLKHIFDLLKTNQFDQLNQIIETIDTSNTIETVTFLRSTYPARHLLSKWNQLLEKSRETLLETYECKVVDLILRGLV